MRCSRVGAKEIVEMRNEPNVASGRVIIVVSPRLAMTSYPVAITFLEWTSTMTGYFCKEHATPVKQPCFALLNNDYLDFRS